MKHFACFLAVFLAVLLICGCTPRPSEATIAATTLPVYEFTSKICQGTGITVTRLVTENVSCLHDYTLQVDQMRRIEAAQAVVISGAGLEEFLEDALTGSQKLIDASAGIPLICHDHEHTEDHEEHGHHHENDPHIWLSPANAASMARTICQELEAMFPEHASVFQKNLSSLLAELDVLDRYAHDSLSQLSCREIITFHDGFAYLAECYNLTILEAVEEESGSEASAAELIHLITLARQHHLPAIFTEISGADSAARIISAETGLPVFQLDMAMAGNSYFESMYHNIDTLKEALQ